MAHPHASKPQLLEGEVLPSLPFTPLCHLAWPGACSRHFINTAGSQGVIPLSPDSQRGTMGLWAVRNLSGSPCLSNPTGSNTALEAHSQALDVNVCWLCHLFLPTRQPGLQTLRPGRGAGQEAGCAEKTGGMAPGELQPPLQPDNEPAKLTSRDSTQTRGGGVLAARDTGPSEEMEMFFMLIVQ